MGRCLDLGRGPSRVWQGVSGSIVSLGGVVPLGLTARLVLSRGAHGETKEGDQPKDDEEFDEDQQDGVHRVWPGENPWSMATAQGTGDPAASIP